MVLRTDRRTAPALAGSEGAAATSGFTVTDVGRLLSRERNRQGLSLQDVAMRTGIPVAQLRAAETGDLDQSDGLATLKTVRRYADLLGLPGDRFALAILERWPTKGGVPRPLSSPAGAVPALGPLARTETAAVNGHAKNGNGSNGHTKSGTNGRAKNGSNGHGAGAPVIVDEPTRLVDPIGPASTSWSGNGDPAYWGAFSDTGVNPAVVAPADHVRRRPRRRIPAPLKALILLVALAVLAGVALLAIDRTHPSWLRSIGLVHSAGPTTAPTVGRHGSGPAGSHGTAQGAGAALHPRTTSGGALFTVHATSFSAKLTAPGGPCWVQVTTDTSTTSAFAGILDPGNSRTFAHVRSLVVELGSTSGRLSITSSGGHVTAYAAPGAPYKITVHSRH